jgi:hypothetical protein
VHAQRCFKTGPGEYGEGDVFLGIRVPVIRALIKQFESMQLQQLKPFLTSRLHEERLFAVLMMTH